MSNVAVYLIIMLAVAAVIVIACVFAYNRRIPTIRFRSPGLPSGSCTGSF